jgi:hypothetical protein
MKNAVFKKQVPIIPNEWKPCATTYHWIALWVGFALVVYGFLILIMSIAVVILKFSELPDFFIFLPISMFIALFLGVAIVFAISSDFNGRYNKLNPPPEDLG